MIRLAFFFLSAMVWAFAAQAVTFKLGADVWYPFFFEEGGQRKGISYDIVQEIMRRTANEADVLIYPNRRLRRLMKQQAIDGLLLDAPIWDHEDERTISIYSDPILSVTESAYMRAEGEKNHFSNTCDLSGLKVAISAGYYYPGFDSLFRSGQVHKFEVPNHKGLYEMLIAKRVDAFFMDNFLFGYMVKQGMIDPTQVKQAMSISNTKLSLRLHKKMAPYMAEIDKTIKGMIDDGFVAQVVNKYIQLYGY